MYNVKKEGLGGLKQPFSIKQVYNLVFLDVLLQIIIVFVCVLNVFLLDRLYQYEYNFILLKMTTSN